MKRLLLSALFLGFASGCSFLAEDLGLLRQNADLRADALRSQAEADPENSELGTLADDAELWATILGAAAIIGHRYWFHAKKNGKA